MSGEMETKLIVDASRVNAAGEELEGEVDVVDLDESLVRSFGGVRYRLTLRVFGSELLVQGHLEQDFDLVCSRCGKDFDDTVKVDDFTMSYEFDGRHKREYNTRPIDLSCLPCELSGACPVGCSTSGRALACARRFEGRFETKKRRRSEVRRRKANG